MINVQTSFGRTLMPMRSDYYVSGRFYGTLYSIRIHYVMSLNAKYVVRSFLTTAFSQSSTGEDLSS
jgi:hypothetical protein